MVKRTGSPTPQQKKLLRSSSLQLLLFFLTPPTPQPAALKAHAYVPLTTLCPYRFKLLSTSYCPHTNHKLLCPLLGDSGIMARGETNSDSSVQVNIADFQRTRDSVSTALPRSLLFTHPLSHPSFFRRRVK